MFAISRISAVILVSRENSANPDISRNFCLAIWIFSRFQIVGLDRTVGGLWQDCRQQGSYLLFIFGRDVILPVTCSRDWFLNVVANKHKGYSAFMVRICIRMTDTLSVKVYNVIWNCDSVGYLAACIGLLLIPIRASDENTQWLRYRQDGTVEKNYFKATVPSVVAVNEHLIKISAIYLLQYVH